MPASSDKGPKDRVSGGNLPDARLGDLVVLAGREHIVEQHDQRPQRGGEMPRIDDSDFQEIFEADALVSAQMICGGSRGLP